MALKSFKGGNFEQEQGADRFFKKSFFMRNMKKCIFSIVSACLIGFLVFPVKQERASALGEYETARFVDTFTNGFMLSTRYDEEFTSPTPRFYGFGKSLTYYYAEGDTKAHTIDGLYNGYPAQWDRCFAYGFHDVEYVGKQGTLGKYCGVVASEQAWLKQQLLNAYNNMSNGGTFVVTFDKKVEEPCYFHIQVAITFRSLYGELVDKFMKSKPMYCGPGVGVYHPTVSWEKQLSFTEAEEGQLVAKIDKKELLYVDTARFYIVSDTFTNEGSRAVFGNIYFTNTWGGLYSTQKENLRLWAHRIDSQTPTGLIFNAVGDFFQMELFPNFKLYYFLLIGFGIMIIGLWIKIALGG